MQVLMSAYFTSYVHISHHPLIPTSLLQPICISHGLRAIGRGIGGQIPLILAQMASVISLSHTIYLHISWSTLSWSFRSSILVSFLCLVISHSSIATGAGVRTILCASVCYIYTSRDESEYQMEMDDLHFSISSKGGVAGRRGTVWASKRPRLSERGVGCVAI